MSNTSSRARAADLRPGGKPLSALTKQEASEWLRGLGEEPRVTWTSMDIMSRSKEILDLLAEEEDGTLPKNLTGMKKADLQRECAARSIHFTEYETKGSMVRKIREQVEAETGGKSGSIMGFGKYRDLTFEEVAQNYPGYVRWARDTVKEEGLSTRVMLRKFVTWLNNRAAADKEQLETMITGLDQSIKEAEARLKTGGGRSSSSGPSTSRTPEDGRRRVKRLAANFQDPDDMKAETPLMTENPTPKNRVEEQIIGALGKLEQRLSSLETQQVQPKPEKHYIGSGSESWAELPSARGAGDQQA